MGLLRLLSRSRPLLRPPQPQSRNQNRPCVRFTAACDALTAQNVQSEACDAPPEAPVLTAEAPTAATNTQQRRSSRKRVVRGAAISIMPVNRTAGEGPGH